MLEIINNFLQWKPLRLDAGDYFFALARYLILIIPVEMFWGLRHSKGFFRPGYRTDFLHMTVVVLFSSILIAPFIFLTYPLLAPLARFFSFAHVTHLPTIVQVVVVLAVGDLLAYGFHICCHRFDFLWKFHGLHHSSEKVDWLAGFRLHLVDYTVIRFCFMVPGWILAMTNEAGFWAMVFIQFLGFLQHADLRIRFKWVENLIITPYVHHWHHNAETRGQQNYAHIFPVIDRVFGTFCVPKKTSWPKVYGDFETPFPNEGYLTQFMTPFKQSKKSEWLGAK